MQTLHTQSYILLSTRKRDGSWVATPVWAAGDAHQLFVVSEGKAGKIKRLRNFADIRLAPCTVTGKPLGPEIAAQGFVLDDTDAGEAHRQLLKKYGLQMRLLDLAAWLSGKIRKRRYIRIDLPKD
ncbi:PPOX class F420-dependent oxidoreductase [Spongiibacter tropicus]|uniref:PPOX class F420-dependent oxidoreductase n=1 Tax=Spongiibacter tropicus TaxID=454602 RepID=UPI003A994D0A